MNVSWVPSGDPVEFNSAEKLKEMIERVDKHNEELNAKVSEI